MLLIFGYVDPVDTLSQVDIQQDEVWCLGGQQGVDIHDYFDVDLDTVWETAKVDIPPLLSAIGSIIQRLEEAENNK